MNPLLAQFERESHIDVYALGRDRQRWEHCLTEFAEQIVRECARVAGNPAPGCYSSFGSTILEHFGVEESKGWVCSKCGTDRTKQECPKGYTAALTGECLMIGVAQ